MSVKNLLKGCVILPLFLGSRGLTRTPPPLYNATVEFECLEYPGMADLRTSSRYVGLEAISTLSLGYAARLSLNEMPC